MDQIVRIDIYWLSCFTFSLNIPLLCSCALPLTTNSKRSQHCPVPLSSHNCTMQQCHSADIKPEMAQSPSQRCPHQPLQAAKTNKPPTTESKSKGLISVLCRAPKLHMHSHGLLIYLSKALKWLKKGRWLEPRKEMDHDYAYNLTAEVSHKETPCTLSESSRSFQCGLLHHATVLNTARSSDGKPD